MLADILSVVLRALSFVFLLQAAGAAIFVAAFGRQLTSTRSLITRVGRASAFAAAAFVAGHYVLEAARMAGDLDGMVTASLQTRVLHSSSGAMATLRILGLLLVAYGLRGDTEGHAVTSVMGATLAVASFALVGHSSANPERWLLLVMLIAHLLIVAYWFGALVPLYLVASREATVLAGSIIESFSRVAAWLVPGILLAGLVLAFVLIPDWKVFREAYGELLIVKVVGFAVLMLFAALNKWRLGPAIARGEKRAVGGFRRSIATEYVVIVTILAATAVMTSFFSPE
jgi:putative copper export protein